MASPKMLTCGLVASLLLLLVSAVGASAEPVCRVSASDSGDDTEALQAALVDCAGGRVQFQPGTFWSGPLQVASDTTLELARDATLFAIDDPQRYVRPDGGLYALINASDASGVSLEGSGTIDGNGSGWWQRFRASQASNETPDPRPRLVVFERCSRMRAKGITLQNSPSFHLVFRRCSGVDVDGLTILAPPDSPNTDGIDPMASHDIRIVNTFIDTGDDNIAVKSGTVDPERPGAGSSDIVISNCTLGHGHGVSIGSETNGGVQNMRVKDSRFHGTQNGIRIKTNRGVGGSISNVTYENLSMEGVQQPIAFASYYPRIPGAEVDAAEPITASTPSVSNIIVRHLRATGATRAGWVVGLPEAPYADIVLDDVRIEAESGLQVRNAALSLGQTNIVAAQGTPLLLETGALTR